MSALGTRQARSKALEDTDSVNMRRCIVSGRMIPRADMIRFVAGPDRLIVADLDERLPGRGFWLSADRDTLKEAATGKHFSRALRGPVDVPPDLLEKVEAGLVTRCKNMIGLARRAGAAICGFEKARSALKSGNGRLLIAARDGAADGRKKLQALAGDVKVVESLDAAELGAVFGRDNAVHVVVTTKGFANGIARACRRLQGIRGNVMPDVTDRVDQE